MLQKGPGDGGGGGGWQCLWYDCDDDDPCFKITIWIVRIDM